MGEQSHLPEEVPPNLLPTLPPSESTPPAASMVTVEIGGQQFHLPQDVAAAFQAELQGTQGLRDDLSQTRQQLDAMSQQWQSVQNIFNPQATQQTQELELMYSNPQAYRQQILNEAAQQTRLMMSQHQSQQDFWSNFYRDNPELDSRIVNSAIANSPELQRAGYTPDTAKRLAEESRSLALAITQKYGGQPPATPAGQPPLRAVPRTTVESGHTPITQEQPPVQEEPPKRKTMADLRKAQRTKKRGA